VSESERGITKIPMRQRGCLSTTSPVGRLTQTLCTQHVVVLLKRTHTNTRPHLFKGPYLINNKHLSFAYSIPQTGLDMFQSRFRYFRKVTGWVWQVFLYVSTTMLTHCL